MFNKLFIICSLALISFFTNAGEPNQTLPVSKSTSPSYSCIPFPECVDYPEPPDDPYKEFFKVIDEPEETLIIVEPTQKRESDVNEL